MYRGLVARGELRTEDGPPEPELEERVRGLQALWEAIRQHHDRLAEWRAEHAAWVRAHAAWREDAEGWDGTADSMWEEAVNAAHDLQREGFDPDSLLEPPEPARPAMDPPGCYIEGDGGRGTGLAVDLLTASLGQGARRTTLQSFLEGVRRTCSGLRDRASQEEAVRKAAGEVVRAAPRLLVLEDFSVTSAFDAELTRRLLAGLLAEDVALVALAPLPRRRERGEELAPGELAASALGRPLLEWLERCGVAAYRLRADDDKEAKARSTRRMTMGTSS